MKTLTWTRAGETPHTCGAASSGSARAMHCELPPDHVVGGFAEPWSFHYGRDRIGRWRAWAVA